MDRSKRNLLIGASVIGALGVAGFGPLLCSKRPKRPATAQRRLKRPPGLPKPLLEEDIRPVLARLDAWYEANLPKGLQTNPPPPSEPDKELWKRSYPSGQYAFNPPATDAQIDAFERVIGLKLSNAHRQLYRWHNGDDVSKTDAYGHIYGISLMPLDYAAGQWKSWSETLASPEFAGNPYWAANGVRMFGAGWPSGAVDPAYINRRWIPLTSDWSGNHIGIDYDPWPAGRVGQVIIFGADELVKVVLAESLGKFLEWIADLFESGNFRTDATGEPRLRLFRMKNPPVEDFHTGARILLGAPDTVNLADDSNY